MVSSSELFDIPLYLANTNKCPALATSLLLSIIPERECTLSQPLISRTANFGSLDPSADAAASSGVVVPPLDTDAATQQQGAGAAVKKDGGKDRTGGASSKRPSGAPGGFGGGEMALDVTPVELIDAIVTEKGIIEQPDEGKIANLMSVRQLH